MTLTCFQRALTIAEDETLAEVGCLACYLLLIYQSQVWYNVGHLSLGIGDVNLAYQCFRLALTANNDHAESYNNIGDISRLHTQHHYMVIFYRSFGDEERSRGSSESILPDSSQPSTSHV